MNTKHRTAWAETLDEYIDMSRSLLGYDYALESSDDVSSTYAKGDRLVTLFAPVRTP
jgi:hypothetical protein